MAEAIVYSARIDTSEHPHRMLGMVNGREEYLFSFYCDEIQFSPEEMIGKTPQQCRDLFHKRDIAYLQS